MIVVALLLLVPPQQSRSEQQVYDITFAGLGPTGSSSHVDDLTLLRGQNVEPAQCDNYDCTGCEGDCGVDCLDPCYVPRWRAFGEFLYLRPGNEKVAFAVPVNGAIVPPAGVAPVQIGLEAVVDSAFEPGVRVGFSYFMDECSDLVATYTHFESDETEQITIDVPFVIRSLVSHPGAQAAPTDFLAATARLDLDFQLADLDYRRLFSCGCQHAVYYFAGIRYCHLDQFFDSTFTNAVTTETVSSQIRFDGGGIRVGVEGERHLGACGLMLYGRSAASFVGGNFRGRYLQNDTQRGDVVITGWNEDGVISILDLELGGGWSSSNGRLRATAGYMFSGWFNTLNTDEFIQAVQTNNSVSVGDSLSFDGLVARTEYRY